MGHECVIEFFRLLQLYFPISSGEIECRQELGVSKVVDILILTWKRI